MSILNVTALSYSRQHYRSQSLLQALTQNRNCQQDKLKKKLPLDGMWNCIAITPIRCLLSPGLGFVVLMSLPNGNFLWFPQSLPRQVLLDHSNTDRLGSKSDQHLNICTLFYTDSCSKQPWSFIQSAEFYEMSK